MSQNRTGLEWITLLVSLVMLGVYILWSTVDQKYEVEQREQDRLSVQARVIDIHISQQLSAIRHVLTEVRERFPIWQNQQRGMSLANERLSAFTSALTGVRSLSIVDATGFIIASNLPSLINHEVQDREYFQLASAERNPGILHISPPFTAVTGNWVILLSMTVLSDEGEFTGLVIASLDQDRFRASMNAVNYADDMWSAIAHGDGLQFIMEPDRAGQAGMNLAQPGSFFTRHVESHNTENVLSGKVYSTGEHRTMALRTIQPAELKMDKPLVIAVGRDSNKIFQEWRWETTLHITLFAMLLFVSVVSLMRLQRIQREKERNAAAATSAINKKNSELETLNESLRSLALMDGLTGIANRRHFDDVIDKEWRRCEREQAPLALMMIDIDHFKDFNDHYGHLRGDDSLKLIANTISQELSRGGDLVARYGGEEFVCLVPKCDLDAANAKAESIRLAIAALDIPHEHSSASPHVTISIGLAVEIPTSDDAPASLTALADKCLYRAKQQGRNRVCSALS
ncbi:deoxyribonuclease [Marinobacterium zhoushanense]|uniref:diguanylate cyclase n=1 Tax=Marinobacterium zhoushanense TaxID=1679163 RepID=A0ABQ1K360_9GAMM|nr:diguanylate cyclase [Marinobacterium zhoushanense]GGB82720.1 deoxyribonuclease [Marinobacterium zhoushanense]